MKTKVLVGITALLTALLVAMVCLFLVLDRKYREQNKANYADDMSYFLECMELEKEWISKQQSKEGAIYLYELEEKTEGSVVPYFACQAALGMLAGNPNKDELDIVGDYLNWHTGELIQSKGMISDYRVVSGELISKGTSDSIDSYVAMYLTLLATFVESEGELDGIEYAEAAVNVCAQRLEELNTKGLTKVAPGKEVYYLMDNVEVLQAYGKILNLLQSGNKAV
ncbi:MAG: hypothetical protein IJB96_08290, partial [Lachnospira sp.]|nr:hypothetical protein [Lachnospira sp.]